MEQHLLVRPDHLNGCSVALTAHQQLHSYFDLTESVMNFDKSKLLEISESLSFIWFRKKVNYPSDRFIFSQFCKYRYSFFRSIGSSMLNF